jgi:arylformamidase
MALYDATLPLREGMLAFPGDPLFAMEPFLKRAEGDPFDLALLRMCTHTGTHIDPPAHYLDGGATVDMIPLDVLVGPGIVLDMRGRKQIDRAALENACLHARKRVLLKTDNGPALHEPTFSEDYVSLTEDGAEFLLEQEVVLVGIDYLSIEKYRNPGAPVHTTLLTAGVLVLEAVDLLNVPPGLCEVYCLPLRIQGADGAPARVVIRREDQS